MMFTTNGFETYPWDDVTSPQRKVSGVFIFNQSTVDMVLEDLMTEGLRWQAGTDLARRFSSPRIKNMRSISLSASISCILKCAVFSEFINDQSLSQSQIVFVKKVIDYVVQNGYIENISELMNPPFDRPQSFIMLFDGSRQRRIVEKIAMIKDNAVKVVG